MRSVESLVNAVERRLPSKALAWLLTRMASWSSLGSVYLLIKGTFRRESGVILAGRALHASSVAGSSEPVGEVRRNTHRLEKGLCVVRPHEDLGLAYVDQLVGDLETLATGSIIKGAESLDSTTTWSLDVLSEYFRVSPPSARIEHARARYQQLLELLRYTPSYSVRRVEPAEVSVTFDQLRGLVAQRMSVRLFESTPVGHELLDKAFDVARWSPSACNRLAYEFRVYEDPNTIAAIVDLAPGMSGWAEFAPCLMVATGRYRSYAVECDRHLVYIDIGLAAMTLQYAFTTLGLASCCCNWPEDRVRENRLGRLLELDQDEKPVLVLAVGFARADQLVPSSSRPGVETIRSYHPRA